MCYKYILKSAAATTLIPSFFFFFLAAAGYVVEATGSFALVFQITAALNIIGAIVWNAMCSAEKQFD